MYRVHSLVFISVILFSGAASAQVLGRAVGGATGAVNGTVNGSVNGTLGADGAVRGVAGGTTEGVRGGIGAAGIGSADAVSTMRQSAALSSMVEPLLPKGFNATQAAAGFDDTNQFMTTLHAAHNMNVPFEQLKAQTTGKGRVSIEKASARLRPDLDEKTVKENLKLAGKQSDRDIAQASMPRGNDRVAAKMASDSELSSRASTLLPPGSNVNSAATGFHDENQFLATAQAAHNLNVPFEDMKDRVTAGQSLREAIQAMKPGMSDSEARTNAQTATSQAAQFRSKDQRAKPGVNAKADADAKADANTSGVSANANANTNVRTSARN